MPELEERPQPFGENIQKFIRATHPKHGEHILFQKVFERQDNESLRGNEMSSIQTLAHIFLDAGRNGLLELKQVYFKDTDLISQAFWLNPSFKNMHRDDKEEFLENYAAIVVGAAILAITHIHEGSDQEKLFPLGEFVRLHNTAVNHVMTNLLVSDLLSENHPMQGTDEVLSDEQWRLLHGYCQYKHKPILSSDPKIRDLLPASLKMLLEKPTIAHQVNKIYANFRIREKKLNGSTIIPEGFYAFDEDKGMGTRRYTVPSTFTNAFETHQLDPTQPPDAEKKDE